MNLPKRKPRKTGMIVREIRRDPDAWGPNAEERALAHWFDHMNEFSGNSVRYWAESLRQELAVARQEIVGIGD